MKTNDTDSTEPTETVDPRDARLEEQRARISKLESDLADVRAGREAAISEIETARKHSETEANRALKAVDEKRAFEMAAVELASELRRVKESERTATEALATCDANHALAVTALAAEKSDLWRKLTAVTEERDRLVKRVRKLEDDATEGHALADVAGA